MRFRKRGRFSLIIRVFLKVPAEDEFGMVQTGYKKKASSVAETQFARGEEDTGARLPCLTLASVVGLLQIIVAFGSIVFAAVLPPPPSATSLLMYASHFTKYIHVKHSPHAFSARYVLMLGCRRRATKAERRGIIRSRLQFVRFT